MREWDLHDTARKRAEVVACIGRAEAAGSPADVAEITHTLGWEAPEVAGYLRVVEALDWAQERDRAWRLTAHGIAAARTCCGEEMSVTQRDAT